MRTATSAYSVQVVLVPFLIRFLLSPVVRKLITWVREWMREWGKEWGRECIIIHRKQKFDISLNIPERTTSMYSLPTARLYAPVVRPLLMLSSVIECNLCRNTSMTGQSVRDSLSPQSLEDEEVPKKQWSKCRWQNFGEEWWRVRWKEWATLKLSSLPPNWAGSANCLLIER